MRWPWTKQPQPKPERIEVPHGISAAQAEKLLSVVVSRKTVLEPYRPPRGVLPKGLTIDAIHSSLVQDASMDLAINPMELAGLVNAALIFPGYPYLCELAQQAEYRNISGRLASEMTRKWIKLRSSSSEDKSERIKELSAWMRKMKLQQVFREGVNFDGLMGRAQVFCDVGMMTSDEVKTQLLFSNAKVNPDHPVKGFRLVEPIWTYPYRYNSSDPLRADFYRPESWFVMGQEVHDTRLLMFQSRPVPDLFKPAYNFGGISLSQLATSAVNNYLSTREDVRELIHTMRQPVLKTNMNAFLGGAPGGEDQLTLRVASFTGMRSNHSLCVINNDSSNPEEVTQVNTPLSGLDQLVTQTLEHMAAPAQMPLVVLRGITPGGLNASSEGEIRIWYDWVHDQQESMMREPLERALQLGMLSLWGEVDAGITFDFEPLFQLNGKDLARVREQDANSATAYVTMGAVDSHEVRRKLASDPDSGFDGLDVDDPNFKPTPMPTATKKPGAGPAEEAAEANVEGAL